MQKSLTKLLLSLTATLAVGWFNPGCMLAQDSCDNALPDYEVSQAELEERIPENMGTFLIKDTQGIATLTFKNPRIAKSRYAWHLFATKSAAACSWEPPSKWVDVEASLRWQPKGQAEVVVFQDVTKRIEFSGVGRPSNQNLLSFFRSDSTQEGGINFSIRTDQPPERHLLQFTHQGQFISLGYD